MKLYSFSQNNSGGSFVRNDDVTYEVLVEADSFKEANKFVKKATNKGVYFNGCSKGYDCNCCGDRWSKCWDDDIDNYSTFEFTDKEAAITHFNKQEKGMFREECIIYFKDGSKEKISYAG